jgi:hypothetical protein
MRLRSAVLALLMLPALLAGRPRSPQRAAFPSDSEMLDRSHHAEVLEIVCPGHVRWEKQVVCGLPCPESTSFHGETFDWSFFSITRGHFLYPESDDALVATIGCEPHQKNFGGTILLTRRSGRWVMLWYKAGIETGECHKVELPDKREILVCLGGSGTAGYLATSLYIEDLLHPAEVLMASEMGAEFFTAIDDTATCGTPDGTSAHPKPVTLAWIERIVFRESRHGSPALVVIARYGRRQMTGEDVEVCLGQRKATNHHLVAGFFPMTRAYRIEFEFDGHTYKPTPSTAWAARVFEER